MKKCKTLSTLLLVMLMVLLPLQAGLAAAQTPQQCMQVIERSNNRFCVEDAIKRQGLKIVHEANAHIEEIIAQSCRMAEQAHCEAEIDCIIVSMLVRTHTVSAAARIAASLCGVETICEYIDVSIGGRVVSVDPLRVVRV